MIFSNYPPSVKFLFGLRNRLATLFGLKSSEGFHNYISEQTSSHTRINKDDKHLSVSIMLECGDWTEGCQLVSLATFVKFHNQMGKIYFFAYKASSWLVMQNGSEQSRKSRKNNRGEDKWKQ